LSPAAASAQLLILDFSSALEIQADAGDMFLTTNLIDRYLCVQSVSPKNLQLVGVTAMLLTVKYKEIWAPKVNDFVHISDNAYSREEVLTMEKNMLNTLKFNLKVPTPYVLYGS
jgi:hypothetical protein